MENQKILGNICFLRTCHIPTGYENVCWNETVAYIESLEHVLKGLGVTFEEFNNITTPTGK